MRRKQPDYAIVPHMDAEAVDCCGCLVVDVRGDEADLVCNECSAIIRTVPTAQVESTLLAMMSGALLDRVTTFLAMTENSACVHAPLQFTMN